jgi:hypothetical protein
MVIKRAKEKGDTTTALHDITMMVEWELEHWEEIQEQKKTSAMYTDTDLIAKNVWEKRVDELVCTVASLLHEGTGVLDLDRC